MISLFLHNYMREIKIVRPETYLLIQHVGVFCEPHTQKLEGSYNHGVEVSGLKRSWTATLVDNVPTYRADGTFAICGVYSHLHLVKTIRKIQENGAHKIHHKSLNLNALVNLFL